MIVPARKCASAVAPMFIYIRGNEKTGGKWNGNTRYLPQYYSNTSYARNCVRTSGWDGNNWVDGWARNSR